MTAGSRTQPQLNTPSCPSNMSIESSPADSRGTLRNEQHEDWEQPCHTKGHRYHKHCVTINMNDGTRLPTAIAVTDTGWRSLRRTHLCHQLLQQPNILTAVPSRTRLVRAAKHNF